MADILQDELITIEFPDLDGLRLHLGVSVANSNTEKREFLFARKRKDKVNADSKHQRKVP